MNRLSPSSTKLLKGLVVLAIPLFLVRIIGGFVTKRISVVDPGVSLILSGIAFAGLTFLGLALVKSVRFPSPRQALRQTVLIPVGWLTFAILLLLQRHAALILTIAGCAIFVAAMAEEIVFRVLLPDAISTAASNGVERDSYRTTAIILAQLLFSVSHLMLPREFGHLPITVEATRLVLAGLMYTLLVARVGLWFASAVHAAMNADQFYVLPTSDVKTWTVILGVLALIVLGGRLVPLIRRSAFPEVRTFHVHGRGAS